MSAPALRHTRGYHALVQVLYELQQDGQYSDDEGEETAALAELLAAIEPIPAPVQPDPQNSDATGSNLPDKQAIGAELSQPGQVLQPQAEPVECDYCSGHGLLGNRIDDAVMCDYCGGSGKQSAGAAPVAQPERTERPDDRLVDQLNADRYRFIREGAGRLNALEVYSIWDIRAQSPIHGEALDAAIDAAMKASAS